MSDNTIQGLRVLQAGIEAVKAQGTLTIDTRPTANDTVTIGSTTYTWVNSGAVSGQINKGTNLPTDQANFVAAINGVDSIQAGPNPFASASDFSVNVSTITARLPGVLGNSIATTETFTAVTNIFNAATLGTTTAGAMARGTLVAATRRLEVETLDWAADDENLYHPKVANGVLARYTGPGTPVQHGTRFSMPSQAFIWEQAPWWISMLLGAPTITGALGGPYTLVWTSAPTTNPNPFAATIQRRFSNGLGDNVDERAGYALLDQMALSFAANEDLKLEGKGFARKFGSSAITGGLTLGSFEVGVSALSTIYFDTLWSGVGSTLIANEVIGWKWELLGGVFPRPTAEGRTDLDFTKHQINGEQRGINLEVTCLLDPVTYAAEQTRAASPSTNQFAAQVRVVGSNGRSLKIDQMVQHEKPLWAPGVDQGQDVITFSLLDSSDGTNFLRVTMVLPDLPSW